jgi:quinol-cytochrome oxidoreductase complex cytochrome b subunit
MSHELVIPILGAIELNKPEPVAREDAHKIPREKRDRVGSELFFPTKFVNMFFFFLFRFALKMIERSMSCKVMIIYR